MFASNTLVGPEREVTLRARERALELGTRWARRRARGGALAGAGRGAWSPIGAGDAFFGSLPACSGGGLGRRRRRRWATRSAPRRRPRARRRRGARSRSGGRADRARVRRIRDRLREVYGIPAAPPHGRGLDELILTVLSQSTNDRNRDVAFLRLRRRFAAWEAVRDAPNEEVEEAIRPGGISKVKSQRIQDDPARPAGAARRAAPRRTASSCSRCPASGARPRPACCCSPTGSATIPVDTHVSRVGTRLGLFRAEGAVRGDARRDARDHPARAGARVAREPAPPRPPDLPRAPPGL